MKKGVLLTFATFSFYFVTAQEVTQPIDSIQLDEMIITTDAEIGSK